eukprot:SAG22_NODE_1430_length_4441_cov_2.360894_1_plen_414_part_00
MQAHARNLDILQVEAALELWSRVTQGPEESLADEVRRWPKVLVVPATDWQRGKAAADPTGARQAAAYEGWLQATGLLGLPWGGGAAGAGAGGADDVTSDGGSEGTADDYITADEFREGKPGKVRVSTSVRPPPKPPAANTDGPGRRLAKLCGASATNRRQQKAPPPRPTLALVNGTTGKLLCAGAEAELLSMLKAGLSGGDTAETAAEDAVEDTAEAEEVTAQTVPAVQAGASVLRRWLARARWTEVSRRAELSAAYGEQFVNAARLGDEAAMQVRPGGCSWRPPVCFLCCGIPTTACLQLPPPRLAAAARPRDRPERDRRRRRDGAAPRGAVRPARRARAAAGAAGDLAGRAVVLRPDPAALRGRGWPARLHKGAAGRARLGGCAVVRAEPAVAGRARTRDLADGQDGGFFG